MMKRLAAVDTGVTFEHDGCRYVRDITGRDGSGRVAVVNLDTNEKGMMLASQNVWISDVQVDDKANEPDIEDGGVGSLDLEVEVAEFRLDIPMTEDVTMVGNDKEWPVDLEVEDK